MGVCLEVYTAFLFESLEILHDLTTKDPNG